MRRYSYPLRTKDEIYELSTEVLRHVVDNIQKIKDECVRALGVMEKDELFEYLMGRYVGANERTNTVYHSTIGRVGIEYCLDIPLPYVWITLRDTERILFIEHVVEVIVDDDCHSFGFCDYEDIMAVLMDKNTEEMEDEERMSF